MCAAMEHTCQASKEREWAVLGQGGGHQQSKTMKLRRSIALQPFQCKHVVHCRRQYNWEQTNVDPATHRFGAVGKDNNREGVRKALQPALDQTLPVSVEEITNEVHLALSLALSLSQKHWFWQGQQHHHRHHVGCMHVTVWESFSVSVLVEPAASSRASCTTAPAPTPASPCSGSPSPWTSLRSLPPSCSSSPSQLPSSMPWLGFSSTLTGSCSLPSSGQHNQQAAPADFLLSLSLP